MTDLMVRLAELSRKSSCTRSPKFSCSSTSCSCLELLTRWPTRKTTRTPERVDWSFAQLSLTAILASQLSTALQTTTRRYGSDPLVLFLGLHRLDGLRRVVTWSGRTRCLVDRVWFSGQTKATGPRSLSLRCGSQEMIPKRTMARKRRQRRGYFFPGESKISGLARISPLPFSFNPDLPLFSFSSWLPLDGGVCCRLFTLTGDWQRQQQEEAEAVRRQQQQQD